MLIHVFNSLLHGDQPEELVTFLKEGTGIESFGRVWRDGDHLQIEGLSTDNKSVSASWSSAHIYQKLSEVRPRVALPVLWKLCRYYDTDDETCEALRSYLLKLGLSIERVPFYRKGKYSLYTKSGKIGEKPEINPKRVKLVIDKNTTDVIIFPHRGVIKTLLGLLEATV